MKAQNTINLGQISGEMKTWNNFILRSKGLIKTSIPFFCINRWFCFKNACMTYFACYIFEHIHTGL